MGKTACKRAANGSATGPPPVEPENGDETQQKEKSKLKTAVVDVAVAPTTTDKEDDGDEDGSGAYKPPRKRKSKDSPRVRTHFEIERPISKKNRQLVRRWSYKPDRGVDDNAILYYLPGRNWQWSPIFTRKRDPILFLLRISEVLGVIGDVYSWMNIYQRDFASQKSVNHDMEAQCPSFGDIKAFIDHCEHNMQLIKDGKKPISFYEVPGFEPGTIFTYQVVNFGRPGPVLFFVSKDGSDSPYVWYQLLLTDPSFCRTQHTHGHPSFTIPAYLCKLRRHVMQDINFFDNGFLSGDNLEGSKLLYDYAMEKGWFLPATDAEICKLVEDRILRSATCSKADMFRGIQKGKRGEKEPFFTTLKTPAPNAHRIQPNGADSPPRPARQTVPKDLSEYPEFVVTSLPWCVQELNSDRPIRPQFERVLVDGKEKWVLPEEWIRNPPENAYAPVEFTIANSLYPRQKVVDRDASSMDVAGPGPHAMSLRKRKRTEADS